MTTVHCWDEYSYEEQEKIIEENQLMKNISDYLEAAITLQSGWQITYVFIDPTDKTLGCKSFLLSYLLQKAGLKNIRVSRQQHNLIETEEYTYTQVKKSTQDNTKTPRMDKRIQTRIQKQQNTKQIHI